jgi:hypothetical protein
MGTFRQELAKIISEVDDGSSIGAAIADDLKALRADYADDKVLRKAVLEHLRAGADMWRIVFAAVKHRT